MSRRGPALFALALGGLIFLRDLDAVASPVDAFGFGPTSIARAGAVTATADDVSAGYYNPAGLARRPGLDFSFGYALTAPSLALNGGDLDVDVVHGFQGGVRVAGELLDRRVAVSLLLHLPDSRITRVRALPQGQPRFALFDNRPQRIVITTSGAVEVLEDLLYVGFGLTYLANTVGGLDLEGSVSATSTELTTLLTGVDVNFESVRYPSAGVLFTPGNFRFGVSYRHEFVLKLDLGVDVRGKITLTDEELVLVEDGKFILGSTNHNLFSPSQLNFGAAYEDERLSVGIDVTIAWWSRYPAEVSAISIDLDLGDLAFELPVPEAPIPPEFSDIVILRVGGEWFALRGGDVELSVRGGYAFEPSPAPDQPSRTNYVDLDKHLASVGLGLSLRVLEVILPRPITIDVAGQAGFFAGRRYSKASPADPVGDYSASGRYFGIAAAVGLEF